MVVVAIRVPGLTPLPIAGCGTGIGLWGIEDMQCLCILDIFIQKEVKLWQLCFHLYDLEGIQVKIKILQLL